MPDVDPVGKGDDHFVVRASLRLGCCSKQQAAEQCSSFLEIHKYRPSKNEVVEKRLVPASPKWTTERVHEQQFQAQPEDSCLQGRSRGLGGGLAAHPSFATCVFFTLDMCLASLSAPLIVARFGWFSPPDR
jgi:hypothetical protein